jgi:hypothetical protein
MSAGLNISTGDTNFCLGLNAGYTITTSSDNIAIGAYTMAKNLNPITTTNGRNVAIGHYASHSLEGTPANNITIGYQSLYNATSCSDNICIGTNAGNSITTGGGNICLGGSSTSTGGTLTAGQGFNIGLGIASNLYVSNSATNNIGLGAYSNFNTSTGTNNISIGPYTQASTATGNNQITISTNGTSGTPISGKGDNTAFIDARNGLYSYTPLVWHLVSTSVDGFFRTDNWSTNTTAVNIGNPAPIIGVGTIRLPLGVYKIIYTGAIYVNNSTVYPQLQYQTALVPYTTITQTAVSAPVGTFFSVSLEATIRIISTTTDFIRVYYPTTTVYGNTGGLPLIYASGGYNGRLNRYLSINFVSV